MIYYVAKTQKTEKQVCVFTARIISSAPLLALGSPNTGNWWESLPLTAGTCRRSI